ncbi:MULTISPECIES: hypothetical protein [Rhizobium]|uniref:hypothetical protein n=1 Tax=Rhizobium TaxID=379 RepID=UPI0028AA31EE
MNDSCLVLTPAERQAQNILERTEEAMLAAIDAALERASKQAAEELQSIGSEIQPPAYEYFAAVAHQQLFLLLCGANRETFQGGDPEVAAHLIRNAQNISDHYWKKKDAAADVSGG